MEDTRILNKRKRWLLRQRIPIAEIYASLAVGGLLAAMLVWVGAQKENFNAGERDLAFEVLALNPVEDKLYRLPLKAWSPPGSGTGSGAVAGRVNLGAFPAEILSGGWAIATRPRRFDRDTLFQKINGEAEKFIRQGFQELHFIRLKAPLGEGEIAIEYFDQGDFAGALGIFSDHHGGGREILRKGGAVYFSTPVGAIGFSGRHFFRIAGNEESSRIREKSLQLVDAFSRVPSSGVEAPYPFVALRRIFGLAPGQIAYQRRNVFQYDFAGDFWFGSLDSDGERRVFLHEAASPQAALALYRNIAEEHAAEFQVLHRTEDSLLMRNRFLNTHFAMMVKGPLLLGVENDPDPKRTEAVLTRLMEGVSREG